MRRFLAAICLTILATPSAYAATCGNDSSGFERWKKEFTEEARSAGIKSRGLNALMGARYSHGTIKADRSQKGVKYSFDRFVKIRLGSLDGFAAGGRKRKAKNPNFYANLEKRYGVPAGIIIAIHGMETAYGNYMWPKNAPTVVSSILTVAYDCRRASFFTPHALAALEMVDRGMLSPNQKGAYHGELGHTQFLPGNALKYGVDGNGDGRVDFYNQADALTSTAHFLRKKGWKPGKGYQQGEPNFRVLNEWNAATVYQQAIAASAIRIDR